MFEIKKKRSGGNEEIDFAVHSEVQEVSRILDGEVGPFLIGEKGYQKFTDSIM